MLVKQVRHLMAWQKILVVHRVRIQVHTSFILNFLVWLTKTDMVEVLANVTVLCSRVGLLTLPVSCLHQDVQ